MPQLDTPDGQLSSPHPPPPHLPPSHTGNFLDGSLNGKGGAVYGKHAGLALETQGFPDAVNQPDFPSVILRPGEEYVHKMSYRFYTVPA